MIYLQSLSRFYCIETITEYNERYFQLEVRYSVGPTTGDVLLPSSTTRTADSSCTMQDDGITQYHHTSVSCSSKVCSNTKNVQFYTELALLYFVTLM